MTMGKDAAVLQGIPFARPPVGEGRWSPPRRMKRTEGTCWKGVYQAINFPKQCPQLDPTTNQYKGMNCYLF